MSTSEEKKIRVPMTRPGYGTQGQTIRLRANHFDVRISNTDGFFFHYSVALYYEDGTPVEMKGVGRKVMEKINQTYKAELGGKEFAYDGEKTLFTVGSLPKTKLDFIVVLDQVFSESKGNPGGNGSPRENEKKRRKRVSQSKTFKVQISYATQIPMKAISDALRGKESQEFLDAIRVLDIVLRQHAAKQGCLLVKQSFFHDDDRNFTDLGGGVLGCRGFHSSFRATQNGLSLNMDGTLTTTVRPGALVDFLLANQNLNSPYELDWLKVKRIVKNLKIKVAPANTEWKIIGLSEDICKNQRFLLKRRSSQSDRDAFQEIELTVYDYFVDHRNIKLRYSGDFPCINVGRPKRPNLVPIELCSLLPLQRYTKVLTVQQRSSLVEKSRQKPQEKMNTLSDAFRRCNYAAEPILHTCGIMINREFMQVDGRVLAAPKLKFGDGQEFPRNGRWNVNRKRFAEPIKIERWVLVNFSARCNIQGLCRDLEKFGGMKGISIEHPLATFEENPQDKRAPPPVRVDIMIEKVKSRLQDRPNFILCILPDRKNADIYGPWKKKALVDLGIFNQCMASQRVNEQYLTNLLLKINAKLGGLNQILAIERNIPVITKKPTIIFGMDVSHGSPGQAVVPSIAAVVSSRSWPSFYRYRASVRSQSPKVEMIDSLYKPLPGGPGNLDGGIIRELLEDFYKSSCHVKPLQVVIFRDGVSESQFKQVLNVEFEQILQACKRLDETWDPKFTIIVAQKNHHNKFFQQGSPDNVPPGTVIDSKVCHPLYYDFFMCTHAGMIGTTRPTHYHVLLDQIGFSPDELQELIHSLSYVYQKSTTAISIVAPIRYAHLAASQFSQFLKHEDLSDTSSAHGSITSAGNPPVPELPKLHERVFTSMFFC